jgi:hypothetical protein
MYFTYQNMADTKIIVQVNETSTLQFFEDPANLDYQAYLAWVAEGNTAEEWTGN